MVKGGSEGRDLVRTGKAAQAYFNTRRSREIYNATRGTLEHKSQALPRRQEVDMRVRIQHDEQRDLFPARRESPRHFKSNQSAQRIADEVVRTVCLQSRDRLRVEISHVFDSCQGLVKTLDALGL